LQYIVIVIMD